MVEYHNCTRKSLKIRAKLFGQNTVGISRDMQARVGDQPRRYRVGLAVAIGAAAP